MAQEDRLPRRARAHSGNPYLRVLREPGARSFVAAGFFGRMPMAMLGLGIVLLVSAMTGKYGTAGAVAATGALCYAVLTPRVGRLVDRFGQARVLRPLCAVFGASALAFVTCVQLRAPLWTLFVTGGLLGGTMPSLGSFVRARWSYLVGTSPLLHTAFSLESVADELIFVSGPAIVTILATQVHPVAGIAAAAGLSLAGTIWLATQRRTEPPVQHARRTGSAMRVPGMLTLAVVYMFLGAMFGTVDLSTVAFAAEHGHRPLAGLILGTYAAGSAVGGLWYGARQWRAPLPRRFLIGLAGVVLGVAPMWALPSLPVLFVVLFFSGLSIAPMLITGFSLIEHRVPAALRTEGMSWLSTAIGVGIALGPPIAGHIIDASDAHWGYAFALGCGTLAAAAGLLGARSLRSPCPPARPARPAAGAAATSGNDHR